MTAISCTSGQTGMPDSQHDTRYYVEVRDFISSAIHSRGDTSAPFILEDSVSTSHTFEFLQYCLSDTAFTSDEKKQIQTWAAHSPFKIWTTDLIPDAHLISKDTIKSIFSQQHRDGWDYFHAHFGRNFNTLGCPLFLRNYTWCIFYSGNHCGWLCGSGQLALYKKEGSHWVFVKNWGTWAS